MPTSSYQNFELQPLAGQWRAGQSERKLQVVNPFNQENLLELNLATKEDLDESFITAREAQKSWALMAPAARAAIMLKAVAIFDQRHDEIVEWIIAESGSTRIKAQIEWGAARAITLEAASFPSRVHGFILPNDIPGKESRVYRKPLGVVGVISPWNFPPAPNPALGGAGPSPGKRRGDKTGQRYAGYRRPADSAHL